MPTVDTARERIAELLAEPVAAAAKRERTSWAAIRRGTDGSVVLFGAGRLGRLCARALRRAGVPLRAFCDRNAALRGTTVEGAVVLSPEEAVRQYGASALFVVSIWTGTARESMVERVAFLRGLGCHFVATYAPLVWAHGGEETPFHSFDLPSRVLAHSQAIRQLTELLTDPASLQTLLAVLRQRLRGEFDSAPPASDQYFPREVVALRDDEFFVDGGAFTGDTLDAFLQHSGGRFHAYHAFEPDPQNEELLRQRIAGLAPGIRGRIKIHAVALCADNGPVAFAAEGDPTSKVSAGAAGQVAGCTLDSVVGGGAVTFLKLDVEGGEREALLGARSVLVRCQPLVAVCVYHAPDDLWEIPLRLREMLPQHRFYLRQHQFDGYELVAYAVPHGRSVGP
jgi:FkbM family methyltransferase